MLNSRSILNTSAFLLLLLSGASFAQIPASPYPDYGGLFYDGLTYADAELTWISPGAWDTSTPKYEHDLNHFSPEFFTGGCTSFTNLPDGYDDCPTAGVLDGSSISYAFGSFFANRIDPNKTYWGGWSWGGLGGLATTNASLTGQEGWWFCGTPEVFIYIWCIDGVGSEVLISQSSLYFNAYGIPTRRYWNR